MRVWLRPYLEDVTLLAKAIVFALVVLIAVAVEGSSAQPTPTWWFLVNLGTFVIWKYRQGDLDAMSVELASMAAIGGGLTADQAAVADAVTAAAQSMHHGLRTIVDKAADGWTADAVEIRNQVKDAAMAFNVALEAWGGQS